jgi:GT2 family glycosyltransferase
MTENRLFKLSIIIVSYNSLNFLKDCLDSINKNKPSASFEITVVDNASSDGTVEAIRKDYPHLKLIENARNEGFAAANNMAIKSSSSEYILLINSDCRVYANSIDRLLKFADSSKDAGIAGPRIINSDGSVQLSCRKFPSFLDAGMHSILTNIAPDNPFSRRYKLADINRDEVSKVDWVSGSCMLIRRAALIDTGLMDEKYFMYVEDTDLCYQMWKKGWKVYYFPESEILHHIGGSTKNNALSGAVTSSIRMQKSVLYFFWKNYRKTLKVLLLPFLLMLLGIRIFLTFIKNLLK